VKATLLPYEKRISVPEKERRYSEVRKRMSRESFDLLVISGNSQLDQRGNLRYMTNWLQPVYEETKRLNLKVIPRSFGRRSFSGSFKKDWFVLKFIEEV
jgi:hypothetical protein